MISTSNIDFYIRATVMMPSMMVIITANINLYGRTSIGASVMVIIATDIYFNSWSSIRASMVIASNINLKAWSSIVASSSPSSSSSAPSLITFLHYNNLRLWRNRIRLLSISSCLNRIRLLLICCSYNRFNLLRSHNNNRILRSIELCKDWWHFQENLEKAVSFFWGRGWWRPSIIIC